jgi:hypothetical protein
MDESSTFNVSGLSLAKIMDACDGGRAPWGKEELGAILEHQLSSPLAADLLAFDGNAAACLKTFAGKGKSGIATFRDLFHHPRPPIELLELTKRFAKRCRSDPENPLPEEISTVLYFLSVAAAMTCWQRRISQLDTEALQEGIEWALAQSWIDDHTRRTLSEGLKAIMKN